MLIPFGKYQGRPAERVFLRDPDFVVGVLWREAGSRRVARLQAELDELVERFDARPVERVCRVPGCGRPARLATVYLRNSDLWWSCERCDPWYGGASPTKLRIIRRFRDAEVYAAEYADEGVELRTLIAQMARAKGLPDGAGEREAIAFFA
jgi:hypothetical protein